MISCAQRARPLADESVLYVNDSRRRHIRAFDLAPNGTLAKQTDRVFADLGGPESGVPDGMKVDTLGNVYCGGAGGSTSSTPKARNLAASSTASRRPHIGFGGATGRPCLHDSHHAGLVNLKVAGIRCVAKEGVIVEHLRRVALRMRGDAHPIRRTAAQCPPAVRSLRSTAWAKSLRNLATWLG